MALSENPTLEEIIDEVERLNNLIVDRGGTKTITPTTTNQILAKGNYKGDITVKGDVNLIPSNILRGKSIFGVQGNLEQGKKWATGSFYSSDSTTRSFRFLDGGSISKTYGIIPKLDFNPSFVFIICGVSNIKEYFVISSLKTNTISQGKYLFQSSFTKRDSSSNNGLSIDATATGPYAVFNEDGTITIPLGTRNTSYPYNFIAFE